MPATSSFRFFSNAKRKLTVIVVAHALPAVAGRCHFLRGSTLDSEKRQLVMLRCDAVWMPLVKVKAAGSTREPSGGRFPNNHATLSVEQPERNKQLLLTKTFSILKLIYNFISFFLFF